MDTSASVIQCPVHEFVECLLGENYPECDMTCPLNSYTEKYMRNVTTDTDINEKRD